MLETIQKDLVTAMKARDEAGKRALRFLKTACSNAQSAVGIDKPLSEAEILGIIAKEVKIRKDAIAEYVKLGQLEASKQFEEEIVVIQKYLPAQMSPEEVGVAVAEAITSVQAITLKDMKNVMAYLQPKLVGKTDMGIVSKLVREKLDFVNEVTKVKQMISGGK